MGSKLPLPRTSFVGRAAEIAHVRELLSASRLITLTGPGGSGKTRLALEVLAGASEAWAARIWLVELVAVDDAESVPRAIAEAVEAVEHPDVDLLTDIAGAVGSGEATLILDSCERLVAAAADAADELLSRCPGLRVLATSREPLALRGEVNYRLPALASSDAERLFYERASAAQPDFAPSAGNAAAVAEICRRVDGVPLAIELAAARISMLTPDELVARLDDRLRILSSSLRDVPERHRTLRIVIDSSFELLSGTEQTLFARLACFTGGFTLDAAERVCAGGEIRTNAILELLDTLAARSLVQVEQREGHTRYRLLEIIREYAAERLTSSGEEPAVRARHLRWFVSLAERAEPELRAAEQAHWLDQLAAEHDNLRVALRWALAEGLSDDALRLVAPLSVFWEVRGHITEGRAWLERVLAQTPESPARARALLRAATLARVQHDFDATRSLSEEALGLLRAQGDEQGVASSLTLLGTVAQSDTRAQSLSVDSLSLARQLRDLETLTNSMQELGELAWHDGAYDAVRALHEESLAIATRVGDQAAEAESLAWLGNVASAEEDWAAARPRYERALTLFRGLAHRRREADVLSNLGLVARAQGDDDAAQRFHHESLDIRRELGHQRGVAISSLNLAELAIARGDADAGRELLAASAALASKLGDERIELAVHRHLSSLDAGPAPVVDERTDPAAAAASITRTGEFFTISFEDRTIQLKDSKGLRHLAVLLAHPHREIHVLDLVRALEGGTATARTIGPVSDDHVDRLVVEGDAFGDAGAMLDDQAKAAYKQRIDELREEITEADSWGDPERGARARAELDALTEQLASAVGLGGRDRRMSSASERARWSVSRAVRSAVGRITDAHPSLGKHLGATLSTGTFCIYEPDPRAPISWDVA